MQGTRGILDPHAATEESRLTRRPPAADLAPWVDYHWCVEWRLSRPLLRETLPYPSVHMAFQEGRTGVFGVSRRRFSITLEGTGSVFAVRFHPGAFRPFLGSSVSALTDGSRTIGQVFGPDGEVLERRVMDCADLDGRIALAEDFLRERLPAPDPMVRRVGEAVALVAADRSITRVDLLARAVGMSVRTLQRTFDEYVGAGPKWVIQRYRLQEAAERLAHDASTSHSGLAYELGYADQAHFIRDFRAMVGVPPAEYAQRSRRTPAA